jgi:hypothetical protein
VTVVQWETAPHQEWTGRLQHSMLRRRTKGKGPQEHLGQWATQLVWWLEILVWGCQKWGELAGKHVAYGEKWGESGTCNAGGGAEVQSRESSSDFGFYTRMKKAPNRAPQPLKN